MKRVVSRLIQRSIEFIIVYGSISCFCLHILPKLRKTNRVLATFIEEMLQDGLMDHKPSKEETCFEVLPWIIVHYIQIASVQLIDNGTVQAQVAEIWGQICRCSEAFALLMFMNYCAWWPTCWDTKESSDGQGIVLHSVGRSIAESTMSPSMTPWTRPSEHFVWTLFLS